MTIPIGILQGRLSPQESGRFQFSPKDWRSEFTKAKELGFASIEWLFDFVDVEGNAVSTVEGREKIIQVAEASGVSVSSICADYYMKHRFTGDAGTAGGEMLRRLIDIGKITTEKLILIPLLEGNAPKSEVEKAEIVSNIAPCLPYAEINGIRIGFETEMPKNELSDFLDRFHSRAVGVYYDIGNATSYGFDAPEDIRFFGRRIFGVHAKDRKVGTVQSVMLGTGDAPYKECISALKDVGFSGTIIMQAWRGEDYLSDAKKQLSFLKKLV